MNATGFEATIDGDEAAIVNGSVVIPADLAAGDHTVVITTIPDDNHNAASVEITVTVNPADASVSAEDITLNVNDNVTIVPTTTPEGLDVKFTPDNSGVVSVDENGVVTAIKGGTATITLTVGGGNYVENSTTITVTVNKVDPVISVEPEELSLDYGEESSVKGTLTPADVGNVSYTSSDDSVVTVDADGNVKAVGAGEATITVSYAGNDKYNPVNTTVAVTVSKVDADIEVSADPITVGEDAVIVVSGLENATGNVTATVDGEKYYAPIVDGVATITVPGLAENATAVVSYPGNNKYNNFTDSVDITVNPKAKENATVDISSNTPREGENVTVSVTLPEDATGNVTAVVGGKEYSAPVKDGKATLNIPGLAAGNYTIPVSYSGDDKYNPAEDNVTVTVNPKGKADSNINVSAENIGEREVANVIVSLPGDATGNVTVILNGESKVININDTTVRGLNGVLSMLVTYSDLVADNYTVIVIYSGDDKYDSSNATTTFEVAKAPKENATMDVTAEPITEGENATVVVTLPEDASGNVTVGDVTVPVVNGAASVLVSGLAVGNTTLSVVYSGDDKYAPAEDNVTVTVNPKGESVIPKEDLNVSVSADEITVGDDAVILVSGLGNATGNVTATVNGKDYTAPIVDGVASIAVSGLAENATAVVSYLGDDKYNNFTESVDIVVNPKVIPKENIHLDIITNTPIEGENAIISITLPKDATGNVTAKIGDKTYIISLKDGKATLTIPKLDAGNYSIPVTYSGDVKYNSLTKYVNLTVEKDKANIISAPNVVKYYKSSERFVVTVTDCEGNPVANKSVNMRINGVNYARTTNSNGAASIALGLNSGVYNVNVIADNKIINATVTILSTVNGSDIVKVYRNGTQYYATFLDSDGNYLKEGTTVKFNIHGVIYERKVSGDKGLAKLNINLEQGEYVITAMNPETHENAANNITVISRLVENNDLTKYYRNASQYAVKVLGDDGRAVGAGAEVTFNINGVLYTRQTNASGIAKLNINLHPGDYIITAEYYGCKVSNDIKVISVLSASDLSMKYRDGSIFTASLVDGQGNPYRGQMIDFNINGMLYQRKTNDNGQARININLMAGQYIITSSYDGTSIANTITISS